MNGGANQLTKQAMALARAVWKWRWLAVMVAWPVALVLGLAVSLWSDRYEATAKVYVDTQKVLKPLMQGLAYQPDIEQQVRMLARTLLSRPNVEQILVKSGGPTVQQNAIEHERQVTRLMKEIKVEGAGGTGNLYTITYRDKDRVKAQQMVESMVDLFVATTTGQKRRDSEDASRFIDEQIKAYESKLVEAENRLKEFKLRNFGVTGMSNQDHFGRMSALSDQVNRLRLELNAAEQTRDAYKRELAQEEPQLPVELATTGPVVQSEVDARLEAQRRQLDDLLRRYTDEHPDVVSARRIIAQLEAQKRQEAEARAKNAKSGRAAATSPVYQRIRIALAESEAQVASLRAQLGAQQAQLEEVRQRAGQIPKVEAELAQLNRDYDVIRRNYDLLVSRRESASLGVKLDESNQLADFRIVEPPRVAPAPVFPGKTVLALLSIIASIAAGVGAAILKDKLVPTFHDTDSLREAVGRPVIGTVSTVALPSARVAARADIRRLAAATLTLLLLQGAWLVWIAMQASPLRIPS
ncbi:MAG: XrtA system polysaccharide chain length determinant [Pseudomonadota bacterium]